MTGGRAAPDRVVLLGGGGHASDVLSAIEAVNAQRSSFTVLGCVDDGAPNLARLRRRGLRLLGPTEVLGRYAPCCVVGAVGYPSGRREMVERAAPLPLCTPILHPAAVIAPGVQMGAGAVVLALAQVSALAQIGENTLISYGAFVGHDSVLEPDCSVMPGAALSGEVTIGRGALIGTNATVLEGRRVGAGARVGAGSVVTRDVAPGETVVGTPAHAPQRELV